jgi:hypothetical protein
MKLLKCKLCHGEVDIINNHKSVQKTVKCRKCGFTNQKSNKKSTEVLIIKAKS